jgi:hypothetical protein
VEDVLHDAIISLIMLALFVGAVFTYINANTDGTMYFSRFFASDLASGAEVAAAGYGDVVLRYDNLKPTLPLTFWFTNGRVAVGKESEIGTAYYGKAKSFKEATIITPTYISLRKIDGTLAFGSADVARATCPAAAVLPMNETAVYLDASEETRRAFTAALRDLPIEIAQSEREADLLLKVRKSSGAENRVIFSPTDERGQRFDCLFLQQLSALTPLQLAADEPRNGGSTMGVIEINITTNDVLTDEQAGKALAHALVVYFR